MEDDSDEEAIEIDIQDEFVDELQTDDVKLVVQQEICWKVLELEELLEEQQKDVDQVQQVLQFREPNDAHIVLKHYRWNTEKLISDYITLGKHTILQNAGIVTQDDVQHNNNPTFCQVCMEDDRDDMIIHSCGHSFCSLCWKEYISSKIQAGYLAQNSIRVSLMSIVVSQL